MLKFYFNGSPNPTKVALFLEELGLPFEPVAVDTRKGDQFKPEFLKVNLSFRAIALAAAGRAEISSTRRLTLGYFAAASSPITNGAIRAQLHSAMSTMV